MRGGLEHISNSVMIQKAPSVTYLSVHGLHRGAMYDKIEARKPPEFDLLHLPTTLLLVKFKILNQLSLRN